MKPLSVEMACLLGIQKEIQAVWAIFFLFAIFHKINFVVCCKTTTNAPQKTNKKVDEKACQDPICQEQDAETRNLPRK